MTKSRIILKNFKTPVLSRGLYLQKKLQGTKPKTKQEFSLEKFKLGRKYSRKMGVDCGANKFEAADDTLESAKQIVCCEPIQ